MVYYEPWSYERAETAHQQRMAERQAEREQRQRRVNLSRLSESQKRKVWQHLKATAPQLAQTLESPAFKQLLGQFQADVYIDAVYLVGLEGLTLGSKIETPPAEPPL